MSCCIKCYEIDGVSYVNTKTSLTSVWVTKSGDAVSDVAQVATLEAGATAANEKPCAIDTLTTLSASTASNGIAYAAENGDVSKVDFRTSGIGTADAKLEIVHTAPDGTETIVQTVPLASFEIDIKTDGVTIDPATNIINITEVDQDGNVVEEHSLNLTSFFAVSESTDSTVKVTETVDDDGGKTYDLSVVHYPKTEISCIDTNGDGAPDVQVEHQQVLNANDNNAVVHEQWTVLDSSDAAIAKGAVLDAAPAGAVVDCLDANCC